MSKAKYIFHAHGIVAYEDILPGRRLSRVLIWKDRLAERWFLRYADAILFLSQDSVERASEFHDFDATKVHIIANGIDRDFRLVKRVPSTRKNRVSSMLFVGDIGRVEKGFEFFTDSLSRVKQEVVVYLVGSNQPVLPNVNRNVTFVSVQMVATRDFAAFMSDKDIFISPSSYETFGLAAVEAMAAGVAVIATHETGMSRYIENGKNGFVVSFGDIDQLASVIKRLLRDRNLCRQTGKRAREIYELLSWETIADSVEEVYHSLLV